MWFVPWANCASITSISLRKCGCEKELRKSPRCELRRRREARPPSRKPINAATPSVARRTEEHAESYNKGFGGIHYSDSPPGSMYKLNEAIQFDINDDCWASEGEWLSGGNRNQVLRCDLRESGWKFDYLFLPAVGAENPSFPARVHTTWGDPFNSALSLCICNSYA